MAGPVQGDGGKAITAGRPGVDLKELRALSAMKRSGMSCEVPRARMAGASTEPFVWKAKRVRWTRIRPGCERLRACNLSWASMRTNLARRIAEASFEDPHHPVPAVQLLVEPLQ